LCRTWHCIVSHHWVGMGVLSQVQHTTHALAIDSNTQEVRAGHFARAVPLSLSKAAHLVRGVLAGDCEDADEVEKGVPQSQLRAHTNSLGKLHRHRAPPRTMRGGCSLQAEGSRQGNNKHVHPRHVHMHHIDTHPRAHITYAPLYACDRSHKTNTAITHRPSPIAHHPSPITHHPSPTQPTHGPHKPPIHTPTPTPTHVHLRTHRL
jgi:hypothetical protein